jgi:WD40 repeat protein
VHVFDSESNYETVTVLEQHSSTITSVKFNQVHRLAKNELQQEVSLITSSADKSLALHSVELDKVAACKSVEALQQSDDLLSLRKCEQFRNKIFSMDIAEQAQYMVVGQGGSLSLHKLPRLETIWEKRFGEEQIPVSARSNRSAVKDQQIQLRVLIDEYASVVVSSSTNKRVTIYEASTGQQLSKASHGGITMAMCFSTNMKNLITASDQGIIFIWRLPDGLAKTLSKIKADAIKVRKDFERIPSVV